ncbi:hypothetical protein M5K25_005237 [Dendrobium thyrsiflorum]|uniref:Inner centromere protein ARK-binding domain-containing protein n=1 Tax=Dendrobium thyrsiflorum TaxID=117978 RepID=A0ABD0VI29_DENTH
MSTMESLFVEIFDRKSRIERQLHQQFESYLESLACNAIADGRRPPPWLFELATAATVCLDPGECRQPSSSFWNTQRKTCSATWEFIQGTLPRDDSDFKSSIHDFVIAPTVEKQNKSLQAAEEIHNAWSSDEVRSTNVIAFESENDHVSQGTEKAFSYVDVFENKASDSIVLHDGSEEGEEPSDAVQCLYGCDVIGISDSAGVKPICDETMTEFKGSNIDLPYMVEDHIFCKEDEIPSHVKERSSTTPCVVEEFLSVCPLDEVRHNSLKPFESQIGHTSCGSVKLFSNVDTSENKACKTLVRYDVSEESMKPYDVAQQLNRFDITGISDIAGVKSICAENIRDIKGSSIDHSYTVEVDFSKGAGIPSLPKERASANPHAVVENLSGCSRDKVRTSNLIPCESEIHQTSHGHSYTVEVDFSKGAGIPSLPKERASANPHAVEEILSGCSRDKVRTSKLIPCESEIHQTSHGVEKLFSHVDTFERKCSLSIGHPVEYEVDKETYDATQLSDSCDVTISDIAGVKPSCAETMLDFKGSNIDLPFTLEDNFVFKDAGMLSLAKERASTTPHIVEEILSACSKDQLRVANLVPFDSEINHTSQCGADAFENKALESLGHHDGSEEGEEPYDASYRFDGTSIAETVGAKSPRDQTKPDVEAFSFDLSRKEDNIVCEDADIPSLAKERAFVLEQLHQSMILLTPSSKASKMNRLDIISDGFNSSPLSIFQNMDLGISLEHNNPDIKHFTASSSIMLMNMFCNNESKLDGPAFESSHSLSSSSVRCGSELQNIPLTPPAIKFSHGRLSGKKSSSSVKVSSNTEHTCFRIDENSPTTEENVDAVQLGYSTHRTSRNIEVSTNSKPLSDVTSLYKNDTCFLSNSKEFVVRDSLESVNSDIASSLGFEYAGRESNIANKENPRYTNAIKELQKATRTVNKMSKRPRASCRSSDRIRNYQNIRKGCKPSNILSSISSLIPLIQQKQQQALPVQRKKDIKVKALEAAEAAKRLEEQMKIEREKRKEAVKLEREKLKQENAKLLKLKQNKKDEERRKKEDVAAKKRQREEDEERKVKDKRRRVEETRTLQRERRDKLRCEKVEKDIQQNAMDEKQKGGKQGKNGGQKKLERGVNATESQMVEEMQYCTVQLANTETFLGGDKSQALEASDEHKSFEKGVGCSNVLRETIEETVSATQTSLELQSYEMSPYQTSDDEDMEEDSRQKKYIPLWARGERLGEIILINQQLDPKDIFSRKRSFNVSRVLTAGVLWRRPLK